MWIVVHFLKENTVESVPSLWFNKKEQKCAWPLLKNKVKRMIEKRAYPNQLEFQWFSARILGRQYGEQKE